MTIETQKLSSAMPAAARNMTRSRFVNERKIFLKKDISMGDGSRYMNQEVKKMIALES
jgi:hypothetical protein